MEIKYASTMSDNDLQLRSGCVYVEQWKTMYGYKFFAYITDPSGFVTDRTVAIFKVRLKPVSHDN